MIAQGDKIDNDDINSIISKINTELSRRGVSGQELTSIVEETKVINTQLNMLVSRITTLDGSHCNCQTNVNVVTHSGCPSYTPIQTSNSVTKETTIIASDTPDIIPDVKETDTDINTLQTIPTCHHCTCNQVCSCAKVCTCQTACFCNTVCSCNTLCDCQSACSCAEACSCEGDCGCASYSPCGCQDTCSYCGGEDPGCTFDGCTGDCWDL